MTNEKKQTIDSKVSEALLTLPDKNGNHVPINSIENRFPHKYFDVVPVADKELVIYRKPGLFGEYKEILRANAGGVEIEAYDKHAQNGVAYLKENFQVHDPKEFYPLDYIQFNQGLGQFSDKLTLAYQT